MIPPLPQRLILQGSTEIETELLRGLLSASEIYVAHEPSLAAGLMGRAGSFRIAIHPADRQSAADCLAAHGLRLDDYLAPTGAYAFDEPFHHLVRRPPPAGWWRVPVRLATLAFAALALLAVLLTISRSF